MDRQIVYTGAIPQDTDLLNTNKNTMIALSAALQAILGTTTAVDGMACAPTGPASLQVNVAAGSIYSLQNLDGTAYGSLAADTTHQIMKQGIVQNTTVLSCPAPATSGQSINYLIQAAYQDLDSGSAVLPYYNSSNPSVAYAGPANSGVSQNTVRQGVVVLSAKAGVSAVTGSQVAPAPDAGYTGLWVVTVANGQTQITSPNIVAASGAPFISEKLSAKISQATGDARYLLAGSFSMGNDAGVLAISTTSTLTTASFGKLNVLSSTGNTITLPLASTGIDGTTISFVNLGSGAHTIQRQGSDIMSPDGTSVTSLTLGVGDTLTLKRNGAATWDIVGGSVSLRYAADFKASLPGNGYQKLPSGMIIQWGTVTGSVNLPFTFPITFPTACRSCVGIQSAGTYQYLQTTAKSASGATFTMGGGTSVTIDYIAIGS